MNKFKKIGLTALAASLVSVSANAGEVTVSGAASMNIGGYSGLQLNGGTSFTMGNQLTFTGGGELDNGLNVSMSFVLDQGDATPSPFDSHSVTISSDAMGSLTLHGEGGSSAASGVDATAAGDVWDTFDGARGGVTAVAMSSSGPGDNSLKYTLPSIMDGLAVDLSYEPQGSGNSIDSGTGFAVTYTGMDGLTAIYAQSDEVGTTTALSGDQTVWKATYAIGPVTLSASKSDFDVTTAASDEEVSSVSISYTVSDELSLTYGTEEIDDGTAATNAEYSVIKGVYTSGGMTLTAQMKEADNVAHGTATNQDFEYWGLGAAFAF